MNIYQTLAWQAKRRPEKLALKDDRQSVSFSSLISLIRSLAISLEAEGVAAGERVVIVADNCVETIAILHATVLCGCIMVPANTRYSADELAFLIRDSEPKLVLFSENYKDLLQSALASVDATPLCAEIHAFSHFRPQKEIDSWCITKGYERASYGSVGADDVAMLIYTSGTTSRPKGAMLTHENLIANSINYIMESDLRAEHSCILAAPLFHISGFGVMHGPMLHAGGTIYIVDRFSTQKVFAILKEKTPTHLFLVSAMWVQMTEDPEFTRQQYPELSFVSTAAGPLSMQRQLSIRRQFPNAQFGWGYGMTESCVTTIKSQRTEELETHPGTLGYYWRHVQYRLVNENGSVEPQLEGIGELQVRGNVVFKGYWNNEAATRDAFSDNGWLKTGDLFRFDKDGFAYFSGRAKDMVKTGGENVAAQEVEQCVIQCAGVRDAAVFGLPDDHLGELLAVAIEKNTGSNVTEETIKAHCRQFLSGFKVPKKVFFVEALPRSSSDKPQKFKLVEMFK